MTLQSSPALPNPFASVANGCLNVANGTFSKNLFFSLFLTDSSEFASGFDLFPYHSSNFKN